MAISLVTLLNTIEFHFLQPLPCLSVDDREVIMVESLCKKLRFLQAFLEDSQKNNINCQAWRGLETEIRDVAGAAETKIESELYLCYNEEEASVEACESLHQTLQQVMGDIESLERRIQLQIESNRNHSVEPPRRNAAAMENIKADSSSKRSSELNKNVMVGCDDAFDTIMHKLITSNSDNLEVISITGMGGIGKTTLAQRVYNDEAAASYFDIRAWTTVSQEHDPIEMLRDLLGSNGTDLPRQLRQKLSGQRYLIVIDDIWSTQAWDDIHRCFPEDSNRSRILLTTRLKQVADYVGSGNNLYPMRFLNFNESWNLFHKKIFVEKKFPLEFEGVGRGIVEKCQGLPLTIIVVAGLLSASSNNSPSLNQWENIVENLNIFLSMDPEEKCSKILSLSYHHLPPHLKACFLHFGTLPEDRSINVKKLIWVWIAEGFLKLELNKSMEEVAHDYLQDLVDRGLVQIDEWRSFGNKIKYCKLHDVLHSFSLREAQREKLLCDINRNNKVGLTPSRLDQKACRWVVSYHLNRIDDEPLSRSRYMSSHKLNFQFPRGHSIPFNPDRCYKLLRVLNISPYRIYHLPREIVDLVHLRFLALRISNVAASVNDYQWCKLRCLQTIIIFNVQGGSFSPNNILGMPQIRHVYFWQLDHPHFLNLPKLVQKNLQTLSWLSIPLRLQTDEPVDYFKWIPNVKELGIFLMGYQLIHIMHIFGKDNWKLLPPVSMEGLQNLHQLEYLKVKAKTDYRTSTPECDTKLLRAFPPNLKKLTLRGASFSWEDMAIISTLPNLEVLKLRNNAFLGTEWKATGNGFCKLKYLGITGDSTLEHWSVDADHFPTLECIFLDHCRYLVEFPTGFGDIDTLQIIDLKRCSPSLETSAKKLQEERRDNLGDDRLVLRTFGN